MNKILVERKENHEYSGDSITKLLYDFNIFKEKYPDAKDNVYLVSSGISCDHMIACSNLSFYCETFETDEEYSKRINIEEIIKQKEVAILKKLKDKYEK